MDKRKQSGGKKKEANSSNYMDMKSIRMELKSMIKDIEYMVELVPRNSKGDPVQTTKVATDISGYDYDEEVVDGNTFTIQHHSKSSIKILWVLAPR